MTRDQVVGIYNGTFRHWHDPTFAALNPNATFPAVPIVPVARFDSSGTTEIFTRALSSFSAAWNATYGVFTVRTGWNASVVRTFGVRITGMADTVQDVTPSGGIGYLSPAAAGEIQLTYASMVNAFGNVVDGTTAAVLAAMDSTVDQLNDRLTGVMVDSPVAFAYPIAGYSYFIVQLATDNATDCPTAVELARYIEWFTGDELAAADAENVEMVPVSGAVTAKIRTSVLDRMTCRGASVMALVAKQKYDEAESLKTWKMPVEVITPIVAFGIACLIAYAVRQKIKYLRMLDRDDWNINFFDIEFQVARRVQPKEQGGMSKGSVGAGGGSDCPGKVDGHGVVVRVLRTSSLFDVNRKVRQSLTRMRDEINHENVAKFYGLTLSSGSAAASVWHLVEEPCSKGPLDEILRLNKYKMTEAFRYAISGEVADGMTFLHRCGIVHGSLKTRLCHVDSRWTVKIVDWEYSTLHEAVRTTSRNRSDPK